MDFALLHDECNGDRLDAMRIGGKEGKFMWADREAGDGLAR
jgi:hypothetical protein